MMKMSKTLVRQAFLYGIIGGCSALLDLSLFTLMYKVFNINELVTNIISVHVGITLSFILNRKFTFKKKDKILFRATSFYLTGLFGLSLSEGSLWLGGIMDLPIMLVKIASVFIVAAVQFMLNKMIAFGK